MWEDVSPIERHSFPEKVPRGRGLFVAFWPFERLLTVGPPPGPPFDCNPPRLEDLPQVLYPRRAGPPTLPEALTSHGPRRCRRRRGS